MILNRRLWGNSCWWRNHVNIDSTKGSIYVERLLAQMPKVEKGSEESVVLEKLIPSKSILEVVSTFFMENLIPIV